MPKHANIDIVLSQTDPRPMYQQIMGQVIQRITLGDWQPGSKIPSIREMAIALQVSVITVKRAYLELERQEVVITRQGQGSWVNGEVNRQDLQYQELEQVLAHAIELADSMSLSKKELLSLLQDYLNEKGS
jgi:GntR family transcriptional regulator